MAAPNSQSRGPEDAFAAGEIVDGLRAGFSTPMALSAIALATLLNPLNTSMVAVALADVQRSFAVSMGESAWLLSAFALTSAIAHPLMGRLADRFGPKRVLLAGFIIVGASSFAATWASTFESLVALRALQALGASTSYPAGLALLRSLRGSTAAAGDISPVRLGIISASGNASAALGPALGGALVALWGWRSVFLVNVPVTLVGAVLALRSLPPDSEPQAHRDGARATLGALRNTSLLAVYAQMTAFSVVFFSIVFGLPLWLEQCRGFGTAQTGAMMIPLAGVSALATPLAVRTFARLGCASVLFVGAVGLAAGAAAVLELNADSSTVMLVAALALFGVANAFSNLAFQADLTGMAPDRALGTAGGFLQTARFVGAGLAAALVGTAFAHGTTTTALHELALTIGAITVVLLGVAARRLARDGVNRTPARGKLKITTDAGANP